VTIPKAMRAALGVEQGGSLVFRFDGRHVVVTGSDGFLGLAGTVAVPPDKRGVPWGSVVARARASRAARIALSR
jgi:bifunctional DNA-binding transcriptional regulator/antitoxin component of YhaV-PrlF toxin-antitoxin module